MRGYLWGGGAHAVEVEAGVGWGRASRVPAPRPAQGRGGPRSAACSVATPLPKAWPPLWARRPPHSGVLWTQTGDWAPLPFGMAGARTLRGVFPYCPHWCPPRTPGSPHRSPLAGPDLVTPAVHPRREACASPWRRLWGPGASGLGFRRLPDLHPPIPTPHSLPFPLSPSEQLRQHFWVRSQQSAAASLHVCGQQAPLWFTVFFLLFHAGPLPTVIEFARVFFVKY